MGNTTAQHLSDRDASWLADTFRRNRERFAGWKMEADPAPSDPGTPPADPGTPPVDPPADQPGDPAKGGKDAILADLAKERDKRQSLETTVSEMQTAHQQQMDAIAKAFGIKTADDAPPDPAQLAEQITAEQGKTTEAEARALAAERKLAVFLISGEHGGNPLALLDSTTFLDSIKDVDHADAEKLGEVIKTAVDKNPLFKAAAPTPPFPGGPRKLGTQSDPGPGLPRLRDAYAQSSK